MNNAKYSPVVLMNPASYMRYRESGFPPFDVAVIDEADSCIGVFELQTGRAFAYDHEYVTEQIASKVVSQTNAQLGESIRVHPGKFWLQVELSKIHGKMANTLVVRDLYLSNFRKMLPEKTILMSGTLFPSHVNQLLSGEEYDYYEAPSPIPPERRPIHAFTEDVFDGTTEGLEAMIRAVLGYYTDRPAVLHCSYSDSRALASSTEFQAYFDKEDKLMAFSKLKGTEGALLAAGATTGLDLVGDRCRLNVILRGAFQSLGSDLVQKRLCLPGGSVWYKEEVLRQCIQAVGRACRTPTDFGRSVITDVRVVRMLAQEAHNLPKYFAEALEFLSWKE
jgi:Rad3-related DNA helicase